MSRAMKPVAIPAGVTISIENSVLSVKGSKGELNQAIHATVATHIAESEVHFAPAEGANDAIAMVGTMRSLLTNMIQGVTSGFEKKLELIGVGYRAQSAGTTLNLALGFSHPVEFAVPAGISIETPSQTEVVIKGIDKQQVGQVAANIRSYRPPEPYKGKGIRYSGEHIIRKEAKKK
ncbi:50S ribosomal protein L6 [Ectothiorhodospiraceae bacterium BW-2]|nr:50S ribosomal protein L6 [Ectothiorhodospiraceae bacterium BW-2]